ncbi:MAG: hypothetical protein R2705_17385 [Ilumatobacteraceae bacterium]
MSFESSVSSPWSDDLVPTSAWAGLESPAGRIGWILRRRAGDRASQPTAGPRVHASFELRVVDPVRYLDHRCVAEATAPRVASGVVAELLTVCSRAELADQRELLGHTVTHRIDAAVRRFGLAACSTFLEPPVGAMVA